MSSSNNSADIIIKGNLQFKVVWEDWTSYQLENNIVLKIKNPIYRIIERPESSPGDKYTIEFEGPVQKVEGDIDIHEPSLDQQINPNDILKQVAFKPLEEYVQIYYIPKYKDVFLLKPVINKISSTSKYDKKGYPIFNVESNLMMTSVRMP